MARHTFHASLDDDGAPRRLDQAIAAAVPSLSRRRARDLISRGSVWVDGARVRTQGRLLRAGLRVDVVDDDIALPAEAASLPPVLLDLRGDEGDVVVVDKPAGVACEPTRQAAASVTDAFLRAGRPLQAVHRLDVDTSGALLLASGHALAAWSRAFHDGVVDRSYLAIVAAVPDGDDGVIDAPLLPPDRTGRARVSGVGKPSTTEWRVLARGTAGALLAVTPRTGRTHQIRVHLAHAALPLVGDHRYATRLAGVHHLGLHAHRLRGVVDDRFFDTPDGARLDVQAPLPPAFVAALTTLSIPMPAELP